MPNIADVVMEPSDILMDIIYENASFVGIIAGIALLLCAASVIIIIKINKKRKNDKK